jgi:hypothetical protein
MTVEERIWRRVRAVLALQGKDVSAVLERLREEDSDAQEAEARRSVERPQDH